MNKQLLIRAFEGGIKRRRTFAYWRDLEESQWHPREKLEHNQVASLRRLLTHAQANCGYYARAWNHLGICADDIDSLDDFRRWPIVDRETIAAHRFEMRATAPPMRLISKATGGSSGVPLHFDLNTDSNDRRMAAAHRGYGWAGAPPGSRQLYLWGVLTGSVPPWRRWKEAFYNRLYARAVLNCFDFNEARVELFNQRLARFRPEAIVAYTNPLYAWARALDERGIRPYAPKSIIVGAEKLHGFQRQLIERVFQAPVFETYGSREFMLIGAECDRHEGLHLTTEHLFVEIVDDEGHPTPDGDEGNVIVTDLYNYGMPFIRYATGDRAIAGFGQCVCGRGLPLLRKVVGRRLDMLTTIDGRSIPGEFFPHLLKEFAGIRRFQVVQNAPESIELRLVVSNTWTCEDRQRLEGHIVPVVGTATAVRIIEVDSIALTRAGKLQVVVNRCGDRKESLTTLGSACG